MKEKTAPTNVCFVIPTYNEAANIVPLLKRLTGLHPDEQTRFLIVDDKSPDKTGERVREFARTDNRVSLLEGPRRGLGQAYARGMVHAMERLDAAMVIQMDADFSHDPADAGRLLAKLTEEEPEGETERKEGQGRETADVVIGSRYVVGGSLDPSWGVGRRMLSRWGNRFARWAIRTEAVRDCTAGFKAIRAEALRAAKVGEIRTRGHTFQVVLLHRLMKAGAEVVEEPIHFQDRKQGKTKLDGRSIVEFWWSLMRIRCKRGKKRTMGGVRKAQGRVRG